MHLYSIAWNIIQTNSSFLNLLIVQPAVWVPAYPSKYPDRVRTGSAGETCETDEEDRRDYRKRGEHCYQLERGKLIYFTLFSEKQQEIMGIVLCWIGYIKWFWHVWVLLLFFCTFSIWSTTVCFPHLHQVENRLLIAVEETQSNLIDLNNQLSEKTTLVKDAKTELDKTLKGLQEQSKWAW